MESIYYNDLYAYITAQEEYYKKTIPINDVWSWSMKEHVKTTELYMNSQLLTGKSDFKPVKNITRPILNLQHRAEDIEVKDVQIYVDNPENHHLSFLVKKYHDEVFVRENDLDAFFDDLNISRIDYGGGLSKKLTKPCPEVVPLQSIAFCDQTDMLSAPIALRHYYSPDQLLDMKKVGWGDPAKGATISIENLIYLSKPDKKVGENKQEAKTPGRYVEVYELHGNLPKRFFYAEDTSMDYETRIAICAFYKKPDSDEKQGVILYTAPEPESPFKLVKRDAIYGRTLGMGGAEELFEPQVWVNYDMIRIQHMLDAASKTILATTDPSFTNKNKVRDMENLEVTVLEQGTDIKQVDTFPRNMKLFENSAIMWENHAKDMGAAQDPLQGKEALSGTPFASLQTQIAQGLGLHDWRRGQYARHLEEIYTDWIIPHIQKEIVKGAKFLSKLSLDELQFVTEKIVTKEVNNRMKAKALAYLEQGGDAPTNEERDLLKQVIMEELKKKGDEYFIEVLAGEFQDLPLGVRVSVDGKSKNLTAAADKAVSIFKFAFANPQGFAATMQIPGMAKSFNNILEYSGMDPVDFSGIEKLAAPQPAPVATPSLQGQPVLAPPGTPVGGPA